ncbi:hypothetical protein RN001_012978 [Aquatica leii]|uniref:Uncharacterized protein n=1 Tax=Aquatica leii TaxID=1421715 RepID=A0AAN7QCS4_9COLE|nr:hypothetical protein RN001_012978 [Aquatica leii]
MNNIVKQIKRSFTVFTALIITVITTRVRAVNFRTCGSEELAQCAKGLSVLTDSGLSFVRSKEDLDNICPDLEKSLTCIHGYSRLCMNLQQRKHFRKLFHGTATMANELCKNGTYQEEFLSHAPCMKKVSADTEVCFNRYSAAMTEIQTATNKQQEMEEAAQRNRYHHHHHHHHHRNKSEAENVYRYQKAKREAADDGLKSVCCSFQEYVDCSTQTIRRACGEDAALFSKGFLDKMASSMIKMHCMEFSAEDCRQKGFHIEGFHTEGLSLYPFNESPSVPATSFATLLVLAVLVLFTR